MDRKTSVRVKTKIIAQRKVPTAIVHPHEEVQLYSVERLPRKDGEDECFMCFVAGGPKIKLCRTVYTQNWYIDGYTGGQG